INGDPMRSFFVGSAVHTLYTWYTLLWMMGQAQYVSNGSLIGFLTFLARIPLRFVPKALAFIPLGGSYVLAHLLWRDSQRAEYLADALSAQTAGTNACVSALSKLQLHDVFSLSVQRVALDSRTAQ